MTRPFKIVINDNTHMVFKFFFIFVFLLCSEMNAECAYPWIDVPKEQLASLCRNESEDLRDIDDAIASYHTLNKTTKGQVKERIESLGNIVATIERKEKIVKDEDVQTFLINIKGQALGKQSYLKALYELYERYDEPALDAYDYFSDTSDFPHDRIPLILNNNKYYESKNAEFWGRYWSEVLDPAHRRLDSYIDLWEEEKKINPQTPPFFLWLEGQNVSSYILIINFPTEAELSEKKAKFFNGVLYIKNHNGEFVPANLYPEEGEWIFVIDKANDLYIAKASAQVRHTSLSRGKPIIGAGSLCAKDGEITEFAFGSGHYLPQKEHHIQTLQFFLDQGVHFGKDMKMSYYRNFKPYTRTYSEIRKEFDLDG